ncbi:MAG TPA: ATP-binding cassette domain-containing protein [Polyangiaceae bacterium]
MTETDDDTLAEGGRPSSALFPEGEPLLRCVGVTAQLGGNQILRGIDLAVAPGSVLGVLGPSGAGKSTLFRCLVGELKPQRGRVLLQGRDVTQLPLWVRARLGVGYVPQTPSVLLDLTVERNVQTFAKLVDASRTDQQRLLENLELAQRLHVLAGELSGGERRRLELLRALISQPKVLICDEPLTGLDPPMVARVGSLFTELAGRGSSIVFADHRIAEVLPFCEEAVLLVDGRILLSSRAADFVGHPAVQQRYLA